MVLSVLSPLNPSNNTCGYCGLPGKRSEAKTNYHAAECISNQLSCQTYQAMIDRGWRRSGTYLYKPDLKRSCCPQYTIRLNSGQFKASKSQRKVVNRFNRFVTQGHNLKEPDTVNEDRPNKMAPGNRPKGGKTSQLIPPFQLETAIHAPEVSALSDVTAIHRFEVTLEPSSFTEEKLALYQSYQREIHNEQEEKQASSFERFLVDSPLQFEDIAYPQRPPPHLPAQYGSYHQLYRVDGKMVAMSVIDILPTCVSSVYFMYDKTWEWLSLGKMSALREISLTNEIRAAGVPAMEYLYMGFYIHSCRKMRYKGEYLPSYLTDPEDYTWHLLEECRPLLDKNRWATFSHPEHSIEGDFTGPLHEPEIPISDLDAISVYLPRRANPKFISVTAYFDMEGENEHTKRAVMSLVEALGLPLAKSEEIVLWFRYVISQ